MRRLNQHVLKTHFLAGILSLAMAGLADTPAQAFPRLHHEDAEVVARSELIVVARMEPGSIRIEHLPVEPGGGAAHVHHARLTVTEVLKGSVREKSIPILIYYGLFPIVGGDARASGLTRNLHANPDDYPKDNIEILDVASVGSFSPLRVKDAREDNLWFLRKRAGTYGQEPGTGDYGIVDPEDFQAIALKPYLLAYLSDDPEAAVRREMGANPEVVERGQRFLDRREIGRILKWDDPLARCEGLLPFFAKGLPGGNFFEARRGIVACGAVAGPTLLAIFREPGARSLKRDVMTMWGEMNYLDCVPALVALLAEHDRFWAAQDLEADWWNNDVRRDRGERRRDAYLECQDAVRALGRLGDARALPAIEATRRRWASSKFGPRGIVVECDEALKAMKGSRTPASGPED